MDLVINHPKTSDPEKIIASIIDCKEKLTEIARVKHKLMRITTNWCHVYMNAKTLEVLNTHKDWTPAFEMSSEELSTRPSKRNPWNPELVAKFEQFDVYRLKAMLNSVIRVVIEADALIDSGQTFFATLDFTGDGELSDKSAGHADGE